MLENFRSQKIIWDRANKTIFEKIEANSGDSNGRKLVVQVINQGVTENLSGTTLSLGWKYRNSAKGLDAFDVVDASKGIFEIYYTTEMLSNIGNIGASLILIDSTSRIESSTFTISVTPSTVDDESVASENSFTALTEALIQVSKYQSDIDGIKQDLVEESNQLITTEKAELDALQLDYANRAEALEETYAPRLTEVTAQLTQTVINPLLIQTFDGSNEPYHPSVLFFDNQWNEYRYWMAYTPFPITSSGYRDRWECPSIAVSNDGVNWTIPRNFANPLVDLTATEIARKDYFSDTSLVMNGATMEVWFRQTNGSNTSHTDIYRMTSTDGVTWSPREKVLDSQNANNGIGGVGQNMRSLQVIYKDGKYISYYAGDAGLRKAETVNPSVGVWENMTTLNIVGASRTPWHMALYYEFSKNIYHMIIFENNETISYLTSSDGLTFTFSKLIISVEERLFSNLTNLYQSYPVKTNEGWSLYVGGTFTRGGNTRSPQKANGLFLMQGKSLTSLGVTETPKTTFDRIYFENDVYLNNDSLPNSKRKKLVFHQNVEESEMYHVNVEKENGFYVPKYYAPGSIKNNIVTSRTNPNVSSPKYVGEIFIRSVNPPEVFIADNTLNWFKLTKDEGFHKTTSKKNVGLKSELDVGATNLLVINSITINEPIAKLLNGVDGQEISLVNVTGQTITLKNKSGNPGEMRLKSGVDQTMLKDSAIRLVCVGTTSSWFEV